MFKKLFYIFILLNLSNIVYATDSFDPNVNTQTLGRSDKPWLSVYAKSFFGVKVTDVPGSTTRMQGTGTGTDYVGEIGPTTMSGNTSYLVTDAAAVPTLSNSIQLVDGSSRTGSGTPADPWIYTKTWDKLGKTNNIGTVASPITTSPYTLTAANCYNSVLYYGATNTINLPVSVAGMNLIIYNTGAFTITIDPNGTEVILRDGTTQSGGVSFTLSSGLGNYVSLVCDVAGHWLTLGYKGTLAQGS